MTHRDRFRAVLEGEVPDRTAWVPRLDIWYTANRFMGTLPPEVEGMTLPEVERYLGMARSARKASVFTIEYDGVEEESIREGDNVIHRFLTPMGNLEAIWSHPPQDRQRGMLRFPVKHYISQPEDYEIMQYVVEHTRYVPDYDAYRAYDAEIGTDGLPMAALGGCPMHTIMLDCVGYERFCYHQVDCPRKVEALLQAMETGYRQMWEAVAESPAEFVLHGHHFNSDMTPPPLFRRYFLPYFLAFNTRMHEADIDVAFHADADLTGLLQMVRECAFDVADTFACAPLVATTFQQARDAWGDAVCIWGAVPSIILEPDYPWKQFRAYMEDLHSRTAGQPGFIMAVSDNIMPSAQFDRLLWIRDLLQADSPPHPA